MVLSCSVVSGGCSVVLVRGSHPSRRGVVKPTRCDGWASASAQHLLDLRLDLRDEERLALDLVQADGVDEELGPQQETQLAAVQLRHQDLLELLQHLAGVPGERVEVAEVG